MWIRADASHEIGSGHVMRCLALAQAASERSEPVTFVCAQITDSLVNRLQAEGFRVERPQVEPGSADDAEYVCAAAQGWMVVDGYQFGAAYIHRLKQSGLAVLMIDDYGHTDFYEADVVLNQNIYANAERYHARAADTRLLLGTRYALLRREFWRWRGWHHEPVSEARHILITMGGSDPHNTTALALEAMRLLPEREAVAVVGGSNPRCDWLRAVAPANVRVECNVTDMPALMAWADVAVTAAGSTCWELLYMGVTPLMVILAPNQRPIAEGLAERGIGRSLGDYASLGAQQIAAALDAVPALPSPRLVDGMGALRVVDEVIGKKGHANSVPGK